MQEVTGSSPVSPTPNCSDMCTGRRRKNCLNQITLTFPENSKRTFHRGITLAEAIHETLPENSTSIIAVKLDGSIVDLSTTVEQDATVQPLTCSDPEGLQVFWHSASHVMAQAVQSLYTNVHLGIGPAIANGFYYDFQMDDTFSETDLISIEAEIQRIVSEDQSYIRSIMSKSEAIQFFQDRGEQFKIELIHEIPDDTVSIYSNGDFADLCRGPHVPSTGYIKHFKLLSIAGAYWRGDERNPVLQRIYGIAFDTADALDAYLTTREEAIKRDHRRLGKALDLFSFHPEGPGFPFWHPNGVVLLESVSDYMHQILRRHGYQEIRTPLILNEALWHRSGHWDNYKENMYFTDIDEQKYAVKPMNCPGSLLIYKSTAHSYREFPLKMAEMGIVHRHEKSGVLHGLFRVRQFTQDDAHVFCTPDQMEDEIVKLIELVEEVYTTFGYNQFQIELSTKPQKSIGSDAMWQKAEEALQHALSVKGIDYQVNPGEGAFYGPKIDYHIQDSLGRLWQCGTIQVDFSMPERFDLDYIGADGQKHRPVMIHRAILGSLERFIGILIEHVGGAFPLWLAPVQCIVIPVSDKFLDYANSVVQTMSEAGLRTTIDQRSEKVGYKIRDAEVNKIPLMCIVGAKEMEAETVSVRKRHEGDLGSRVLPDLIAEMQNDIARRI